MKSTKEQLIEELCEQIDDWKAEALYWERKYKERTNELDGVQAERLKTAQKDIGTIFNLFIKDKLP